jgi:hypothetical protein
MEEVMPTDDTDFLPLEGRCPGKTPPPTGDSLRRRWPVKRKALLVISAAMLVAVLMLATAGAASAVEPIPGPYVFNVHAGKIMVWTPGDPGWEGLVAAAARSPAFVLVPGD